jgi:hypothetical protein
MLKSVSVDRLASPLAAQPHGPDCFPHSDVQSRLQSRALIVMGYHINVLNWTLIAIATSRIHL